MPLQMLQPLELLITKAAWGNVSFWSSTRHLEIYLVCETCTKDVVDEVGEFLPQGRRRMCLHQRWRWALVDTTR